MHLVDLARAHIEVRGHRSASQRLTRRFLAAVLPSPVAFALALLLGWLARPFRGVPFAGLGMKTAAAAPRGHPAVAFRTWKLSPAQGRDPHRPAADQARGADARLCAGGASPLDQPCRDPAVAAATASRWCSPRTRAAAALLSHHLGREWSMPRRRRAAQCRCLVERAPARGKLDAILTTASGCGTMIKDYGHLLRPRPWLCRAARREMSELARDITQFIERGSGWAPPLAWTSLPRRLSFRLLASARPAGRRPSRRGAACRQAGFTVRRRARRPPLLRLGRNLQSASARARRAVARRASSPTSRASSPT